MERKRGKHERVKRKSNASQIINETITRNSKSGQILIGRINTHSKVTNKQKT